MNKQSLADSSKIDICLLIPVLNESENIDELILRIEQSLSELNYILVFVDDGSKDDTVRKIEYYQALNNKIIILKRQKLQNGCQRGGALLFGFKTMIEKYKVDVWIEMDGDLSHQPEEIIPSLKIMEQNNHDVLIISKYFDGSEITDRNIVRNAISSINSYLFRITFSRKIKDYSNGFRFYNSKAAKVILSQNIKYTTPIYLGEVLIYWLKSGLRIGEIPGKYIGRKKGVSQVVWRDVAEGLAGYFYLIKIYYYGKN